MSPSIPFLLENTSWLQVTTEAGGTTIGVKTGAHVVTLNNSSGEKIVIGSYVQNGAINAQETTNFTETINNVINFNNNIYFYKITLT